MGGHVTSCYTVVRGSLKSPLNLFISFAKALMEQGFRSGLFFGGGQRSRSVHRSFGYIGPVGADFLIELLADVDDTDMPAYTSSRITNRA